MAHDGASELVHAEARRVDDQRGSLAQRREQVPLGGDAVEHGVRATLAPFRGTQRMRTTRAAEAAQQRLVSGIEEHHLKLRSARLLERLQNTRGVVQEPTHTHVDAERDAPQPRAAERVERVPHDGRGQVVDAKEAEILERVHRSRFASAAHTRHHHHELRFEQSGGGGAHRHRRLGSTGGGAELSFGVTA